MQIREALIQQPPSLALQRAAADEIARLDALVGDLRGLAEHYHSQLDFFDPQQPLDLEDTRV